MNRVSATIYKLLSRVDFVVPQGFSDERFSSDISPSALWGLG
jgi:hypothetical protein